MDVIIRVRHSPLHLLVHPDEIIGEFVNFRTGVLVAAALPQRGDRWVELVDYFDGGAHELVGELGGVAYGLDLVQPLPKLNNSSFQVFYGYRWWLGRLTITSINGFPGRSDRLLTSQRPSRHHLFFVTVGCMLVDYVADVQALATHL